MRLINADKLEDEIIWARMPSSIFELNAVNLSTVNSQDDVEAIPIEFIKRLIEKFDCERGNAIKDTYAHILSSLIEFWEFEQEKENEAD